MLVSEREARFQALYRETYDEVYYFVLRRVGTVDAQARAEDICHEAFLTVWRRLADVPADLDQARAWIFTVARNCLLHELRGSARRSALAVSVSEAAVVSDFAFSPDEFAAQRVDFGAAWATLTAAEQEALSLAAFENLTGAQAAAVLGISTAAYKFRLHSARSRLRKVLALEGDLRSGSGAQVPHSDALGRDVVDSRAPPELEFVGVK